MKTIWTPMGFDSLKETTSFIEEQWNTQIADAFLQRIDARISQLKSNPKLGPTYRNTKFRQILIHPNNTLYYTIEKNYISLVLVWSNKQNPKDLRRKLKRM